VPALTGHLNIVEPARKRIEVLKAPVEVAELVRLVLRLGRAALRIRENLIPPIGCRYTPDYPPKGRGMG
jgi:hypothetical protein